MQADWQVITLATAIPFVTGDQHGLLCPQTEGQFGKLEQKETPGHGQELSDSLERWGEVRQ